MFEKKNLVVNCNVCDTRKMREEDYSQFESIMINTELMLVSPESKNILNRLPMTNNADITMELPKDEEVNSKTVNGSYEITGATAVTPNTFLSVNGLLTIQPGSEEALKNYLKICVNGTVKYPKSLEGYLGKMTVNGLADSYPDDCILLKSSFTLDKYFPIRAKAEAKYFAASKVIITDQEADIKKLADKKVQFVTKKLIVLESKLEESLPLFDEQVELIVVPDDMAFIYDDVELEEAVANKYGSRLYIYGDLRITDKSKSVLPKMEKLVVKGEVGILDKYLEEFKKIDADYDTLKIQKGRLFSNSVQVKVDNSILEHSPEGIEVSNVAAVTIAEDVSAADILEKVEISNCASVFCSREQESAVQAIATNVARITALEEGKNRAGGIFDAMKNFANAKMVNAEEYVM